MKSEDIKIPPLSREETPDLLKNWHLGNRARQYMSSRRSKVVVSKVEEDSGRVLDIGCGWGYNLYLLRLKHNHPYGIDIVTDDFKAAVKIARENGYEVKLTCADASNLPFPGESFDAVTSVETLEHIYLDDREKALSEISRVLKAGGRVSLSTPNYYSVVETVKRMVNKIPLLKRLLPVMCYPVGDVGRREYHPYSYHRPVKLSRLKKLFESADLEILGIEKIIFVTKNIPDTLFPIFRFFESVMEKVPLIKGLGCTTVVNARKPGR